MIINTIMILNYYFPEKEIPKFNNCFLKIISKSILSRLKVTRNAKMYLNRMRRKNKYWNIFLKNAKWNRMMIFVFYKYPIFLLFFLFFYNLAELEKLFAKMYNNMIELIKKHNHENTNFNSIYYIIILYKINWWCVIPRKIFIRFVNQLKWMMSFNTELLPYFLHNIDKKKITKININT